MSSTYSPSLRIELIGTGDQAGTWGATTNTNLGTLVESAVCGYVSVSVSSANQALTALNGAADESRNAVLALTTTTGANFAVYAPPVEKTYVIYNASSYTATIYNSTVLGNTTAAGTGVAIPAGKTTTVWSDGTNFATQMDYMAAATVGTLSLSNALAVASGGTGTTTSTGTGSTVLSASPALTGTPTAPTAAQGTNTTQIATTAFVLSNGAPTGGLMMWPTSSAPSGWLLCNGQAVSRTTYAALFAIVSTTFGAGDGSTTFNVPDYRDRFPVGAGTTYSANSTGGSKDAIVVSHTHTGTTSTNGDHTHIGSYPANAPGAYSQAFDVTTASSGDTLGYGKTTSLNGNHNHTFTTDSTGSSGTNANLPPYLGIYFIIKT